MACSETSIKGSDEFFDIHEDFFEAYKEGTTPQEIYRQILAEYAREFEDEDEDCDHILMHEVCFALAYCLWECGCRDEELWQKVGRIIESGDNLKYGWVDDPQVIRSRERALNRFWQQINTPCKKPRGPRKERKPRQPTLHKGDLFAYACGEGFRAALVLDFVWNSFLIAITGEVFPAVPDAETVMRAHTHTVLWCEPRVCIPKKDRIVLGCIDVPGSYNNRAGLICYEDAMIGCSSIGERAHFFDLELAAPMMERNGIGRYVIGELLNPDVLPKYHDKLP